MQAEDKSAFAQLHIAVFLFGFTAILGKLISADHFTLVFHRMWLAALGFFFIPGFVKALRETSIKHLLQLLGIGVLVAIHWLTFYGSIKIGHSASLTLGCFGLTSTFTSVLEPLIYRRKMILQDVLLGMLALVGIIIIANSAPNLSDQNQLNYMLAVVVGVFSTFVAALFSTINSTLTNSVNTKVMSFSELLGGFLFLVLILAFGWHIDDILPTKQFQSWPTTEHSLFIPSIYADFIWIALLAWVCTNIAFVMNLNAMKRVSAFTANLAINLEPVYGIVLAALIFNEHDQLTPGFYIGAALILSCVLIHAYIKTRAKQHS